MVVSQAERVKDFSKEVFFLRPRMPKKACNHKRKKLDETLYSEFGPAEGMFLKKVQFF